MPRIRELGLLSSHLPPGPLNAITDVAGVGVGHTTLIDGDGPTIPGQGPLRTGVTVITPHPGNLYAHKVPAAVWTINGYGKPIGFEQVRELGQLETPIALTGTLNAPRVADALISLALETNPHIALGPTSAGRPGYATVNPLVGETHDGFLSDSHARPVDLDAVRAAMTRAQASVGQPVAEGAVGAGTGTRCFGWKGGIGVASRRVERDDATMTLGALVQTNFGRPADLMIAGVPAGRQLQPPDGGATAPAGGSIMIVLATDAPVDARQLERLARRAALGLARTGGLAHHGSGDFVIAFSTANLIPERPLGLTVERRMLVDAGDALDGLFLAVAEAVEEAIYNSLFMAETMVGRDGHTAHALPVDAVRAVMLAQR